MEVERALRLGMEFWKEVPKITMVALTLRLALQYK